MMNLGFYSYAVAAAAYGFFSVLLVFSWRQSLQGRLMFFAMLVSAIWALVAANIALHSETYLLAYQSFEIIRYIAWYLFLFKLFDVAASADIGAASSYRKFSRWALPLSVGFACLLLSNVILADFFLLSGQFVLGITGNLILALIGVAIIEQLFRNISPRYWWATKYLFLGAGGVFVYDFYLYADALLFRHIEQELWEARGIVHAVAVPLLAIASVRNKNWSLNIFVSRDIVLTTSAILGGGLYLLLMAAAGYYLREFGGNWGRAGQIIFITLAVVFLFAVLSSTQIRAKVKVFLGKHFYKNKYDYRLEWLRLTGNLSDNAQSKNHYRIVIEALAQIVDARAGLLWLRDENGEFKSAAVWQNKNIDAVEPAGSDFIRFLTKKGFVVNLTEVETHIDEYEGLVLPQWIEEVNKPWLIVPLHGVDELLGFVVLANPLVVRAINWEDRDLLKTAGKQVSGYLTEIIASAKLAEAKQFEVFSRLSAYMVHDLKNIAAELELVSINAKKHTANPEFIEDAFETVEHAAGDIKRLLEQLRSRYRQSEKPVVVDLAGIVAEVVALKQQQRPLPVFEAPPAACMVSLEKGRLANVLAHLIDNAQQATGDDGEVIVRLRSEAGMHVIEIKDSGHGMDDDFIRNRLFKAFDTTKGNAGMGIGMYESREFVRQLGGDISVQSKPGKGSIISLYIPSAPLQDNDPAREHG